MNLAVKLGRSLQTDLQAEVRNIERAVATGTRDAGGGLKTVLRRQVTSAGLGQRLANSWRDKHYPNQPLDAASLRATLLSPDSRFFLGKEIPMARAYGSSAHLLMKRETAYGQAATGDYIRMPFNRCNLGSEQGLIDDPVLGQGRDPLAPSRT